MERRIYFWIILIYLFSPLDYIPVVLAILLLHNILFIDKIPISNIFKSLPIFLLSLVSLFMMVFNGQIGKEIVEFYKWSTIGLSILFSNKSRTLTVLKALTYFTALSFLMILIQQLYSENELVRKISESYASPELIENNFVPGYVRSTGFNEGPGHIGVLITFTLFVSFFFKKWKIISTLKRNLITLLSTIGAVFAASKGVIPVLLLLNTRFFIILLLIGSIIFFNYFSLDEFYYLDRLTNSASGEARMGIWSRLINNSLLKPFTVIIGNPRIGFAEKITVFDSDWVYVYFTKGLAGLVMIFLTLVQIINDFSTSISSTFFTIILIFLVGFANPALTDIKFGFIYFQLLLALGYVYDEKSIVLDK